MKKILIITVLTLLIFIFIRCNSVDSSTNDNLNITIYDVVIDVGHGGKDPGAFSKIESAKEKDVVLQICKKIKSELEKKGIITLLTREDDSFISLKDRIILVENSKASLIISVHMNTSKDLTKNGYITFYQDNNHESMKLDNYIHNELNQLNLFLDNGSQSGSFYMLTESSIPSIIIDLGYLSNPDDFNKINDITNQEKIAASITQAVKGYLQN